MKQLIIVLAVTLTLFSCEKQKEHIEKFVFDITKISYRTIHTYQFYNNGKIKTDRSVWYSYKGAASIDSTITIREYQYSKTGKISKITNLTNAEYQVMIYNDLDSLIAEYRISDNDTPFVSTTEYENGKIKRSKRRMIMANWASSTDGTSEAGYISYDTLENSISEFIYNGNVHDKTLVKDVKGNVTEEIHYKYDNGVLIKSIDYLTLGDTLYVKQTTNNVYIKGVNEPDHFSINPSGDTIAFAKTKFDDGIRIKMIYSSEFNFYDIWYHNKKGQLIGEIRIDPKSKIKIIRSYSYDDKGNELGENEYSEMISSLN